MKTKTYHERKKNYKLSVFLLSLALVAGVLLLAAIIYWSKTGDLQAVLSDFGEFIAEGGVFGVIFIFFVIIIPLLLVALLIVNLIRRKKLNEIMFTWQEAVRIAAEREEKERLEREAQKEILPDPRFGILNTLDHASPNSVSKQYRTVSSLSELCTAFRIFAATKLGLFYPISDIREFIAGLSVSHILILQGMSGTGKTSLAYAFGEFIGNPSLIVPVQPMWKERTDLLGYYNEFTRRFNETPLLQKMYEANGSPEMYITVLDELNIARVEYYFAEFLSLLEIPDPESRYLDVVPDVWKNDPKKLRQGRIKLPENMWFIGTANNDDSTFSISDKVYDRAMVLELNKKSDAFRVGDDPNNRRRIHITAEQFVNFVSEVQAHYEITTRNERRLKTLDEYLIKTFQISFGNRIMRQIRNYIAVYVSCGGEELAALDDILCKKVFRKLEAQNAAYVRSEAEGLCRFLDELFGIGRMSRCLEYIHRLERNG